MKQLKGFEKSERITLLIAAVCFVVGLIMLGAGREWTLIAIVLLLIHGILMLRVMMIQADSIQSLINEREEYMQIQRKERLRERKGCLKEEIEKTHDEIRQRRDNA